jgi:uncharacterized protein involved in cysteine biosynthesis
LSGVFNDFLRSLGQMGDTRFRRVIGLGLLLALALLGLGYAGLLGLIEVLAPNSVEIPLVGPVGGIDTLLSWGSLIFMLVLSVFLMVPVAGVFASLFLEDVAQAVEDRHYPGLPPVKRLSVVQNLIDSVNFLGRVILVNAVGLILYAVAAPAIPLIFWALNGGLLGREYFALVANRRLDPAAAKALGRAHSGKVWLAGILMAAPLSIPLVNLIVPVMGVATFTHLVHRLTALENRPGSKPL